MGRSSSSDANRARHSPAIAWVISATAGGGKSMPANLGGACNAAIASGPNFGGPDPAPASDSLERTSSERHSTGAPKKKLIAPCRPDRSQLRSRLGTPGLTQCPSLLDHAAACHFQILHASKASKAVPELASSEIDPNKFHMFPGSQ
jgi:hypothetical protein